MSFGGLSKATSISPLLPDSSSLCLSVSLLVFSLSVCLSSVSLQSPAGAVVCQEPRSSSVDPDAASTAAGGQWHPLWAPPAGSRADAWALEPAGSVTAGAAARPAWQKLLPRFIADTASRLQAGLRAGASAALGAVDAATRFCAGPLGLLNLPVAATADAATHPLCPGPQLMLQRPGRCCWVEAVPPACPAPRSSCRRQLPVGPIQWVGSCVLAGRTECVWPPCCKPFSSGAVPVFVQGPASSGPQDATVI